MIESLLLDITINQQVILILIIQSSHTEDDTDTELSHNLYIAIFTFLHVTLSVGSPASFAGYHSSLVVFVNKSMSITVCTDVIISTNEHQVQVSAIIVKYHK